MKTRRSAPLPRCPQQSAGKVFTAWQTRRRPLEMRTCVFLFVYFGHLSMLLLLTFITARYSFSHLSSALSHSPTSISHPTAECISVAMATQSGAPRFPGEASHSWTLQCVSPNTEGLRTSASLSSRAVRERVCGRAQECRTGCRQKIPEPM